MFPLLMSPLYGMGEEITAFSRERNCVRSSSLFGIFIFPAFLAVNALHKLYTDLRREEEGKGGHN